MARIDDFKESFRLASQELGRVNLHRVARQAGAEVHASDQGPLEIRVPFLGTIMVVRVGDTVDVVREGVEGEVSLPEKILICHYLINASTEPPSGEPITFRQVPDGQFYFDAFQRRTRDPFLSVFGRDASLFRACAEALGGEPVDIGEAGMMFRVLPRITIRLALWQGDDEFPPEASVLFDDNIHLCLPVEDIAVLSGMLIYRLMGIARGMKSGPRGS